MKKSIILIVILVCSFISLNSIEKQKGFLAGANLTSFFGEDKNNLKPTITPHFTAGYFYSFPITDKFSFHGEVLYSAKGAETTHKDTIVTTEIINHEEVIIYTPVKPKVQTTLAYIEMPLLVRYDPGFFSNINFNILAGVSPAIKVTNNYEYDLNMDRENPISCDIFDASAIVGFIGTKNNINFELTYAYSFIDPIYPDFDSSDKFRLMNVSLKIGFVL